MNPVIKVVLWLVVVNVFINLLDNILAQVLK